MTDAAAGKIPHVLVIMDGIGHREEVKDNAFLAAQRPNLNAMQAKHPHSLISGSGEDVGLPDGQMGNSEVGHMNLGAGRVLYQDFTRITKDIRTGAFFEHEVLVDAVEKAKAAGGAVHIMGLLSQGGVHSHEDHIVAMAELALKRGAKVLLHAFLDGRDTPPKSAQPSLQKLDALFAQYPGQGRIATLIGRYFAMDRDNRWDRVEQAYHLIVDGQRRGRHHAHGGDLADLRDLDHLGLAAQVGQGGSGVLGEGDALLAAAAEDFDDHVGSPGVTRSEEQVGEAVEQEADQHDAGHHDGEEQGEQRRLHHLLQHDQRG